MAAFAGGSSCLLPGLESRRPAIGGVAWLLSGKSRLATGLHFHSSNTRRCASFLSLGQRSDSVVPSMGTTDEPDQMDQFTKLACELADAAARITLKYFRTRIEIIDKLDLSPVTIADQAAEEAMRTLILHRFPSHAVFGEEGGVTMPHGAVEYTWVLDPIDGTKSFITGKPVFGTLISLVHNGIPILGVIDQPVLKERWVGRKGRYTLLNNQEIRTRSYFLAANYCIWGGLVRYTTSPHLFSEKAAKAFARVRDKVKVPLYGCDCYAYGLLAAGHVDLVVESGLKPYDYLALVPVVEGAGGIITDWTGHKLTWWPQSSDPVAGNVIAAGDANIHKAAIEALAWNGNLLQ